jgi:hypothetical protein
MIDDFMTWIGYIGQCSWMHSVIVSLDCKQSSTSAADVRWYIRDCCACEYSRKGRMPLIYWSGIASFDHDFPREEAECEPSRETTDHRYGMGRLGCDNPHEIDEGKRRAEITRHWYS